MGLTQLVYASRPFGFDDPTLNQILARSRFNNARDDVTGALICRPDIYLQMLEGPEEAVEAAFVRICRDDRHFEIDLLLRQPAGHREFAGWAMRDDPARSWMWTAQEVASGIASNATAEEVLGIFERLKSDPPIPEAI